MLAIDKINVILAQNGMTGKELEDAIHVSHSVYSQWNTKKTKPSKKNLKKIADALGVDVLAIMDDDDIPEETKKAPSEDGANEDVVIQFLHSLPHERLRGILLALGAPEEVLAALDQQEPNE